MFKPEEAPKIETEAEALAWANACFESAKAARNEFAASPNEARRARMNLALGVALGTSATLVRQSLISTEAYNILLNEYQSLGIVVTPPKL